MRVLICGSRTFSDRHAIAVVVAAFQNDKDTVIIQGEAPGADSLAKHFADVYGVAHEDYKAEWKIYGKRAGYLRNVRMLEEGRPDVVWAFVDKTLPESEGTAMMVDIARKAGVPTYVVQIDR